MPHQDSIAVVWRDLLGGIFSVLGRLAYLACCRETKLGPYHHVGLSRQLGAQEADRSLRLAHELVWRNWLSGSLEQQKADVFLYLQDLSTDSERLIQVCLNGQPFRLFPPASASACESHLFFTNLKLILIQINPYSSMTMAGCLLSEARTRPNVESCIAILDEQYADTSLSLKVLSQRMGICADHLSRCFKESTGKTIPSYLRDLRMSNAARLLTTSTHDIKSIASMVGYADGSRFSEHFRNEHGCTPIEFRFKHAPSVADSIEARDKEELNNLVADIGFGI